MCTCIYYVLYCLYCVFVLFRLCIFILICFVCTSVVYRLLPPSESSIAVSNNNKNKKITFSCTRPSHQPSAGDDERRAAVWKFHDTAVCGR
jgi:hypothetical protein